MAMVCNDKGGVVRNRILDFRIKIEIGLENLMNQDICIRESMKIWKSLVLKMSRISMGKDKKGK